MKCKQCVHVTESMFKDKKHVGCRSLFAGPQFISTKDYKPTDGVYPLSFHPRKVKYCSEFKEKGK